MGGRPRPARGPDRLRRRSRPGALRRAALGTPDAAAGLWDLAREVGAPGSLAEIGLTEDAVDLAAELATAAIPDSNPQPVSRDMIAMLLRSALRGDDVRRWRATVSSGGTP